MVTEPCQKIGGYVAVAQRRLFSSECLCAVAGPLAICARQQASRGCRFACFTVPARPIVQAAVAGRKRPAGEPAGGMFGTPARQQLSATRLETEASQVEASARCLPQILECLPVCVLGRCVCVCGVWCVCVCVCACGARADGSVWACVGVRRNKGVGGGNRKCNAVHVCKGVYVSEVKGSSNGNCSGAAMSPQLMSKGGAAANVVARQCSVCV